MSSNLPNKPHAYVAGGSGALGQAICRRFAASHHISFSYRSNEQAALQLVEELRGSGCEANAYPADLLDGEQIGRALNQAATLAPLKALVYASGPRIDQKYFSQVGLEEWGATAQAEMHAFFNLVTHALPHLRKSNGASIVAVTSFATARVVAGDVLSAVPKAGIEMLMRQIGREEGRFGIRANCVEPGILDAGLGLYAQQTSYTREVWDQQRDAVPLRRFGTAQDVANVVAFLASEDAAYVTGQSIAVDGGMSV